jgi:two-component system, chemotaxis family, chemotaxis protein CheY
MSNQTQILIVDDDELVCRVLERTLSRDYAVTVAFDAATALELIRQGRRFDLILTDFSMPIMDGAQMVDIIASIDRAQADRVLFVTANAMSAIVQTSLTYAVIDKPFSPRSLRSLVDRVTAAVRAGYFPEYPEEDPLLS